MMFGQPTTISEILRAVADKLSTVDQVFKAEYVIPTLAQDEYFENDPPADSFILIAPTIFPPNEKHVTGGGNQLFGIDGTIETRFWNRFNADMANSDKAAIEDATFGLDANWLWVLKSLQQFKPVAANGVCILREPMRLAPPGFRFETRRLDTTWLLIRASWEIKFVMNMT